MRSSEVGPSGQESTFLPRRGVFPLGAPGRAPLELPDGLPPAIGGTFDHTLSESETPYSSIRAASIRGLLHRRANEERQDAYSVTWDVDSETLLIVVCDGVGSLPDSRRAADFLCSTLPSLYLESRSWRLAIESANRELFEFAAADSGVDRMASTAVAAALAPASAGLGAEIAWTDDSTVWALRNEGWSLLTQDVDGEEPIHTGSVRALPAERPRIRTQKLHAVDCPLFIMSDGVGTPLAMAEEVGSQLATWWSDVPDAFSFARQVGFARRTFVDDRTVVGVWPKVRR